MKNIALFVLMLFGLFAFGQEPTIEWSKFGNKSGSLIYILPTENNGFYTLRWSGSRMFGHYKATKIEGLEEVATAKMKLVADNSIANFEGARVINNNFVLLLSDKKDNKNVFYMKTFDDTFVNKGKTVELAEYELANGGKGGWFNIIQSEDKEFFAVIWEIPGKRNDHDVYGYKVFDKNINVIHDGEYPLPFSTKYANINKHHVSNNGDYYLVITELQDNEDSKFLQGKYEFKSLHIFRINDDGLDDYELNVKGKRIEAIALSTNNEKIASITGLYGEKGEKGVTGIFYQQINLNTNEIVKEGFKEFDPEFITEGWSLRDLDRAERRQQRGKGDPKFYNYRMREAVLTEDGSIIGTMEQYYIQISSYPGPNGAQSSNTYYYYYNDIIVYKINTEGQFEWLKKVRKYQVSTNDGGPYSSYQSFLHKDKLYFIFNDNIDNYDGVGDYIEGDNISVANFGKRKNCVAIASIDISTGAYARKTLFNRKEVTALAVPKLFEADYGKNEMILYTVYGRKEKFGIMRFN